MNFPLNLSNDHAWRWVADDEDSRFDVCGSKKVERSSTDVDEIAMRSDGTYDVTVEFSGSRVVRSEPLTSQDEAEELLQEITDNPPAYLDDEAENGPSCD